MILLYLQLARASKNSALFLRLLSKRNLTNSIDKLLIANRGEIACRVTRTAKLLGIKTASVFSEADRNSLHVALSDEGHCLGPAPSTESYLNMNKVVEVAKKCKADAIHPGYGFLSESVEFAELCAKEGIIFIGPPATAIRDMGIKSTAKAIMIDAKVPVIDGYHGADQDDKLLAAEAEKIGYPVMLKAVRGGGGKGMRIAKSKAHFKEALDSARRESAQAFGNDDMIVERFVERPRHVEVQVFGDQHGNYVYLYERDCSVQRRHQKIVEEAPAPGIGEETRRKIGEAAVAAAKAVGYVGAGTVEFIMDSNQNFYFMEMNTRLQVEHPVTEMITGQDLVEWQIRVAEGESLPVSQADIPLSGHSFEARIYAEDPDNNFMPGAGRLVHVTPPRASDWLRVETGVLQGDEVSVYYDPMIAKLVVWGPNRDVALKRLDAALADYHIVGLRTNIGFLRNLIRHPKFVDADVYTDFIPDHHGDLFPKRQLSGPTFAQLVAGTILSETVALAGSQADKRRSGGGANDPFSRNNSFRVNLLHDRTLRYQFDGSEFIVSVTTDHRSGIHGVTLVPSDEIKTDSTSSKVDDSYDFMFELLDVKDDGRTLEYSVSTGIAGTPLEDVSSVKLVHNPCEASGGESEVHLFNGDGHYIFTLPEPSWRKAVRAGTGAGAGGLVAPMPGVVQKVLVEKGQQVVLGDSLVVMIAMKMEYIIKAPHAGVVDKILCGEGQSVAKGSQLVSIKSAEDGDKK